MPFSYTIDREKGVVYVRGSGNVAWSDLSKHLEAVLSDPDLPVPYRKLVDLCDVENFNLTSEDARKTADLFAQSSKVKNGKMAFVATQPVIYGMCRVLEALTWKNFEVGIFYSNVEAEKFLSQ